MPRLGPALMIAGAALLVVGLVGRFALDSDDGGAAAPSPSPSASVTPISEPTESPEPSASESPSPEPPPTVVAETPEAFIALFAEAIRTDDDAFLLARLHPVVLELYGKAQCRRQVASLAGDPSFEARVRGVEGPAPYDYAPDGQSITIEDALTVAVTFTSDAGTSRQDAHVAPVGSELRWFTDCGDPLA